MYSYGEIDGQSLISISKPSLVLLYLEIEGGLLTNKGVDKQIGCRRTFFGIAITQVSNTHSYTCLEVCAHMMKHWLRKSFACSEAFSGRGGA